MKKLLPLFLVLTLVAGVPGAWAKNSSSGRSFGSSGFKSLQQLKVAPKTTVPQAVAPSTSQATRSPSSVTVYHAWSPPILFWVPIGGGPMPAGAGLGWVLVIIVGAVILFLVFRPRRTVPAEGDPEAAEAEELEMMYQRCKKNLDHLANTYVDAQTWLERLEGKIPAAQWKDWNDKFTRVRIDDFTRQLKDIRDDLDQGRHVAARAALFSFDEDAVEVFEFFREMENTLEDVG
jgi:hypothetical protein